MNAKGDWILVVDDDYDIRLTLQSVLEDEGYQVALAEDGAVALRKLREGVEPKLILLDLMMPILDGFSFCEQWKADPSLQRFPVVLVSADSSTIQKAKNCGASGWLRKPLQLEQLLDVCRTFARPKSGD